MTETTEAPVVAEVKTPSPTNETPAATTNGHAEEQPAAAPQDNNTTTEETNGSVEKSDDKAKSEKADDAPPPKEMRAVVLTGFGGFKNIKILKKPEPSPQTGEVLIRVRACGLNFQDLMVRLGAIDSPPKTPTILGFECAGEIEAIGEEVEGFKIGDRVVALPEFRAWSELVAVPIKYVYHIPDEMTFQDAAAIVMNYLVAYILIFDLVSLREGKSILLHSVGGGVGQAIVQLARTVPNITIFGVCSKSKHEALAATGLIDHLIDRADYVNEVRKITTEGVDIVMDCLCGEECNRGYGLLKPMGKYILYGSSNVVTGETKSFFSVARSWWQVDKVSPIKLFDENKSLAGFNLRHLLYQQDGSAYVRSTVDNIFALWKDGKIKPTVDSAWALEDVAEAMQKMHDRKNIGKLVLDPALEPKPKPATPAKSKSKKQASEDKSTKKDKEDDKKTSENGDEKKEEEEAKTNGEPAIDAAAAVNGDGEEKSDAAGGASNGEATESEKKESS
ncbi:synaptic vesicle membrane protein VAT-1 homolog-like [Toxorhynchites rutilus septentrionalis]|uniref:synaptic vesicle membrane protein VAT-1 homolog-like n=1 Tax=Toxorhynchites rutilus septentrionalis TaxID=329112 RepID=UPI00247AC288|nr:synaptic vesicle membrane protein VAT-1 homolog-like [Toxorhynchites rutilus septentrionalis]XP_055621064.1 synaptic vesicle membrane protein VAT-1 homolog-like [Toxorhynchites rutilus septentrionalis]XP_055621066.1 synaptic vesicle membrane protein VAT-1 homolog-like [Toxorhynchites rutilus septentrionalis]XP_055621067.1 synaptic vesicle membrane protein VAT-1 homolog-like [Toxorhynchites rutilus septentrionalis]